MSQEFVNAPHQYKDGFDNGVCERLECGRDKDDPVHVEWEIGQHFTFLAWEHRGIEGHITYACNGCGAVVPKTFLGLHFKACPSLPSRV